MKLSSLKTTGTAAIETGARQIAQIAKDRPNKFSRTKTDLVQFVVRPLKPLNKHTGIDGLKTKNSVTAFDD